MYKQKEFNIRLQHVTAYTNANDNFFQIKLRYRKCGNNKKAK
jgi:hypothetical protein